MEKIGQWDSELIFVVNWFRNHSYLVSNYVQPEEDGYWSETNVEW